MFHYRQVLVRMRQGDSDRDIARSKTMGRRKLALVRETAINRGWLVPDTPLPTDAELAEVFSRDSMAAPLPPNCVSPLEAWREQIGSASRRSMHAYEVRNPICQMLRLAVDGYVGNGRPHKPDNPFERQAPQFLTYLVEEKGLRPRTILQYRSHLRQFALYLERVGIGDLATLSPTVMSGFIAEYGPRVSLTTLRNACGTLRILLRYLHDRKTIRDYQERFAAAQANSPTVTTSSEPQIPPP